MSSSTGRTEWRLLRKPNDTPDTDLIDIQTTEAVNRYASFFSAKLDDADGTKIDDYPRGQRVHAQYSTDGGSSWTTKQAGFVQTRSDTDDGAEEAVRLKVIGYDHMLRRVPVFETYTDASVSAILQDVITQYSPIDWTPANVDVQNDATLSREFAGEKVDEILSTLSSASANEEYGVTDNFGFYFRPRETRAAPDSLNAGEWVDYDLTTDGDRAVNFVRVYYGQSGNQSSVVAEDRPAQTRLKEQLGADRRAVIADEAAYPEIGNEEAARAKARQILEGKSPVTTGDVTSFARYGTHAGDVIHLEIPEKDISSDYRVAEVRHKWADGVTEFTLAEQSAGVNDLLVGLSDEVDRIDFRDADPSAQYSRYLDFPIGITVTPTASIVSQDPDPDSLLAGFGPNASQAGFGEAYTGDTTAGLVFAGSSVAASSGTPTILTLNHLRDVWQGEASPSFGSMAVGAGSSAPTLADNSLETGRHRADVSAAPSGDDGVIWTAQFSGASIPGTQVYEWGVYETTRGTDDLLARAVASSGIAVPDTASVTVSVGFRLADDPDTLGAITNGGVTRWRDLYLGAEDPASASPTDRGYGSGTADTSVTDTALTSKTGEAPIESFTDRDMGNTTSVVRWDTSELDGTAFAELGDYTPDDVLVSHVSFETLTKTTDFSLETSLLYRVRPISL